MLRSETRSATYLRIQIAVNLPALHQYSEWLAEPPKDQLSRRFYCNVLSTLMFVNRIRYACRIW